VRRSTPKDVQRATKWNKDNPERRREIVNKSNRKRMDKIIQWGKDHPKQRLRTCKKNRKVTRAKIMAIIGDFCRLCSTKKYIVFHEINYKDHPRGPHALWYVKNHVNDFMPLCIRCHNWVHYLYQVFGVKLDEFLKWLKEREKNDCLS